MSKFSDHYTEWRTARINKIIELFGKEFFNGKTLLELGCGYGDTGVFFSGLGATVTLAEGRQEHVDVIKRKHADIEVICLDQDKRWDLDRKFDIIIHMGVLYHLTNWKQDLGCALNHSNLVVLESEVSDRSSPTFEISHPESDGYDQALHGTAVRTSAASIEAELNKLGANVTRYDDNKLNFGNHKYDWQVNDEGPEFVRHRGYRRFWVVRK